MLTFGSLYGQKTNSNNSSGSTVFCNIFVPNAFTPNGDNINDRFEVKHGENCQVLEYNMKIFDRWGRLIYESNSIENGYAWDGTADGKEAMQGVYMWTVSGTIRSQNPIGETRDIKKQGTVVVIR